ncbi:argininosuccinate synthase [Staphylococcus sp. AntiMn-1]|nr:argininosuccinate synthase [Staphylococcus sp. AntiMn-1]
MKEKIVLAYSGGLDTSVAVKWLLDKGYDVVACCLDVGEGKDLDIVHQKALDMGQVNVTLLMLLKNSVKISYHMQLKVI